MKVYIAGPMRGYPELNHPAFMEAEKRLQDAGFVTYNPAALSDALPKDVRSGAAGGIPRKMWMRLDVIAILGCDGVAVLPGWEKSPGASFEVRMARELELDVIDAITFLPVEE